MRINHAFVNKRGMRLDVISPQPARRSVATCLLLLSLLFPSAVACSDLTGLRLTFGNLSEWREKSFKGHTAYTVVQNDGKPVLLAVAAGTASGLYHNITIAAAELPVIRWSWTVRQTLASENPHRKDGDDFAARVYIVFPGTFFWQTRAIVYVWSDKIPVGTIIPNAFTSNAAIIALESGNRYAGVWRHERRNYVEDYRACFRDAPPDPVAVAVMTDADNTGGLATAWYGDILFARD
jgi:hypothetical protein